MAGDRYTVGADLGAGPDFERVVIVEQPGRVAIVCDPAEARRLAHALLDAIGEPSEAEAIVRSLARHKPVTEEEDPLGRLVDLCACCLDRLDDHTDDTCPYLRARAFVAREGREDTDHD